MLPKHCEPWWWNSSRQYITIYWLGVYVQRWQKREPCKVNFPLSWLSGKAKWIVDEVQVEVLMDKPVSLAKGTPPPKKKELRKIMATEESRGIPAGREVEIGPSNNS